MDTRGSAGDGQRDGELKMDVQKIIDAAVESEQYTPVLASDRDDAGLGVLFRKVHIIGFTNAERELAIAYISRVPPELLRMGVERIASDPRLGAIHGRYDPESKTIFFNPKTFRGKARMGRGPAKIPHGQLTMVHEFGHAVFNTLPDELKNEWLALSGWMKGTKPGQAEPYEEKRPGWPHKISKWTHAKGASFTRHYAEKNPDEDFADTFAFCILGKPAQAGNVKRRWVAQLLMKLIHRYPQAAIHGPEVET